MAFADANRAQMRALEESTWGITPSSGSAREMRITSSSLSASKETAVSDELRADRMVPGIVEVSAMTSGEINYEWSSGPQDEYVAGFLMSTWSRPMTMDFWKGSIVTVSANNTFTIIGKDVTPYLTTGRRIKTVGFQNAGNNGYFNIASVATSGSNTNITVSGTPLTVETGVTATRLYDANDVIVLNDTTVSATAAGFAGTGVFTSAITAGQLVVGQQIAVEGLGYGTATVTFSTAAPTTFSMILSDGVNERTVNVGDEFAAGASHTEAATNLAAFINGASRASGADFLNLKASASSGVVTITNLNSFKTDSVTLARTEQTGGGYAYENVADANVAVTSFNVGTITVGGDVTTSVLTLADGTGSTFVATAGGNWTVTGSGATADAAALATLIDAQTNFRATSDAGVVSVYAKNDGASITVTTTDAEVVLTSDITYTGSVTPRGVFKITGVANDLISVTPSPGTFSAGQAVVIKGSHLRNSGDVSSIAQRSWSMETAFTDVSQYMEHDGLVVGGLSMEIASGAILTGTMSLEGRATSIRPTALLSATPYVQQEAQPGEVSNATTDIGNIEKDGAVLDACIQSLSLSGEAGLRVQNCIGNKYPRGIGTGRFNLSGSATIYFENANLFNDFIQHNTLGLGWSVSDSENASYYFRVPAAKFSANEITPSGIDQDVFESIEWTAFRDTTTNTMFMLDRFSNDEAV